jgi:hypothetical protein
MSHDDKNAEQTSRKIREMTKQISDLQAALSATVEQRDGLLARIDVACEVQIVSSNYDRIRQERLFAADDLEYDLFAAGWKAAIAAVRGAA